MGFDIECIPNIQSLAGEYFCPVCRLLVYPNEALQSMCTHLYCRPCLAYVASTTRACPYDGYLVTETDAKPLAESNKVLADTIGKIVVHCLYQKSGCTWLGSLSESSSHCSGCGFGTSLVVCNRCGIQIEHRQGTEHAQVCSGVQQVQVQESQGSQPVDASCQAQASIQASAQGQGVAAATLTQEQLYQQQYQQYYQNYSGYYLHQQQAPMPNQQQQLYPPGQPPQTAIQHQVPYVQPTPQSVAQTPSQVQAQPQLQSQSLVLHQPHAVFPSAPLIGAALLPQAYPSVPPHSQNQSQTFPASQGLQNVQAQAHSQPTPLSQAHQLHNSQVPQYQQFHSLTQNTTGQGQSHHPHAYSTGLNIYTQPNQVAPNSIPMYHQAGIQPPQVQNHFPQQVPHVRPPQSLPTMPKQQPSVPSKLTSTHAAKQLLLQYGGVSVSETSVMQPAQQPLSKPSLPHQSHLLPRGLVQGLQKHPQTLHMHQPITPTHGLQPQMNHHSATPLQGGPSQAAPSLQAVKQADVQSTQKQVNQVSWDQDKVSLNHTVGKQGDEAIPDGIEARTTSDSTNTMNGVKHAVEINATKFNSEPKGKRTDACDESDQRSSIVAEPKGKHTDACDESDQRSSIVAECSETENGPLGKQVMEENDGNGLENPGKSPILKRKSTEDDPSLNGISLKVADEPGQLVGILNKKKEIPQIQVSCGIRSGDDPSFHQRVGAPSEEVPPGAQRHMHAPRFPHPVLRPHGLEIASCTPPGPAAPLPAERGLRESEGPYDHLHPSQVSKVSVSSPKPFALGLRDERFRPFPDERLNSALLEPAGLRHFGGGLKHLPRASHLDSNEFLRFGAYSSGSLGRGLGQRLPLRLDEKHEPDSYLRPTSRFSQPFINLGERQFRHGLGSPISEYPGIPSHILGPYDHGLEGDRTGMNDIEGRYRFGFPRHLPRREFEGHGHLQMGERVRGSDMNGPDNAPNHVRGGEFFGQHSLPSFPKLKEGVDCDSSALRPGDPGFRSRYTLQGFSSDGGSFPGDVGPFQNSRKRATGAVAWCRICKVDCETLEGLDLHSQTKEHQQKSMEMVVLIKQNAKKT